MKFCLLCSTLLLCSPYVSVLGCLLPCGVVDVEGIQSGLWGVLLQSLSNATLALKSMSLTSSSMTMFLDRVQGPVLVFPSRRHSMTALYVVSRRAILMVSTSWIFNTADSRRVFSVSAKDCLTSWIMFGRFDGFTPWGCLLGWTWSLTLEKMSRWSVQHSAPHTASVTCTPCLPLFLTIT